MQTNAPTKSNPYSHPHFVQPHWIPMGLYVLINKRTATLLDLDAGCTHSGAPCGGWSRNFNQYIDHQLWVISRNAAEGTYRIMSYRAGTFLHLVSGKSDPKSPVATMSYVGNGDSRYNQEWHISAELGTRYNTIECVRSHTVLEIADGNPENGTPVTCSPRTDVHHHRVLHRGDHHHHDGDHQLWGLERVSRTHQEIQALIRSWKSELPGHLVHPFADDVQYLILPNKLRATIYDATRLLHQPVRKGTFDHGDFALKVKDAVKTWARDRFRIDGYSVLFGIIYGNAPKGPNVYNWYLSPDTWSLVFFDPQSGKEYTASALDASGFKPTFAVL